MIALGVAGAVLVVLIVAQLVLPGIAAQRVRDQLSRAGTVLEVKVSAFPAIKLLWGDADSVAVRLGRYGSGSSQIGGLLNEAVGVGRLDVSAQELDSGVLTLHDAALKKRGSEMTGSATIMESNLRSAVPFLDKVEPVASSGGQLIVRGTASLFGLTASVNAVVGTRDGALVVAPDVPFGGIATITLFNDPHVRVQSVSAVTVPGGFKLVAVATVQ
ncbi:MAG TPA: hypothetical protein VEF89_24190 [Solirubrobacteraceae bacterium]|nr:hypothetical protein [Solirubrobacteraceae bacterium]